MKMNKIDYMIQLSYVKGKGKRKVMGKFKSSYLSCFKDKLLK